MSNLTLFGYTPPARFDDVVWVSARIEQSATETGTFVTVETVDLDPVDLDPTNPQVRSFTTEAATVGDWYRLVWIAGDTTESEPTQAVQLRDLTAATVYGTAAELAKNLKLNTTEAAANSAALDRVLLVASGEVDWEIGDEPLDAWGFALATEVALERASEHWQQLRSPFGFVLEGGDFGMAVAARDTWGRHALKLTKIKNDWGIA